MKELIAHIVEMAVMLVAFVFGAAGTVLGIVAYAHFTGDWRIAGSEWSGVVLAVASLIGLAAVVPAKWLVFRKLGWFAERANPRGRE